MWFPISKCVRPRLTQECIVDSCPVPVCDNIRIARCHLYRGKEHRGYCASKRRYFIGWRVHLLITPTGQPVEFVLAPGIQADIRAFRSLPLELPAGSEVYADPAYEDYIWEVTLSEMADITLAVQRKKNSKRPHPGWVQYICDQSLISLRIIKRIHRKPEDHKPEEGEKEMDIIETLVIVVRIVIQNTGTSGSANDAQSINAFLALPDPHNATFDLLGTVSGITLAHFTANSTDAFSGLEGGIWQDLTASLNKPLAPKIAWDIDTTLGQIADFLS